MKKPEAYLPMCIMVVHCSLPFSLVRDHPYIKSAKGLGGSTKLTVLLIFSAVLMLIR